MVLSQGTKFLYCKHHYVFFFLGKKKKSAAHNYLVISFNGYSGQIYRI